MLHIEIKRAGFKPALLFKWKWILLQRDLIQLQPG